MQLYFIYILKYVKLMRFTVFHISDLTDSTQPNSNIQKAVKHKERNYESNTIHLDLRRSLIEKDTIQPIAVEANTALHTG